MANNWSYESFQKWFCDKFKKPNPLPWQDAMQAIIDYITNEIPANMQVVLNKLTSGQSSASLTGNGTPDNPFILTINLSMVDFKGDKGDKGDTGATGPQGPRGLPGVGVTSVDQIELTAVSSMTYDTANGWTVVYNAVIDYGAGDTHVTTATARLPIKPGDNVTIDVSEDGKSLIIKAAAGGSGYDAYLCTTLSAAGYGDGVSFVIFSSTAIQNDSDVVNWFKEKVGANVYPASGGYKYGGGGSDTVLIYGVYLNSAQTGLEAGYVRTTSGESVTISGLVIKKLT